MTITKKFKELATEALNTVDDATELDENLVKFVKSKRSKVRFFWKAGKSTVITMVAVCVVAGFGLGLSLSILLG